MIILGSLIGAAMGLILGTYVPPNRISVTLTLAITPLIFTGSSQYPWPSLGRLRWFQVLSALNPMTYVSEGLRGLMAPGVPHIQTWICFVVAVGSLGVLDGHRNDRLQPPGPRLGGPDRLRLRYASIMDKELWGLLDGSILQKIVVVSPHFDDAALGAAHLLTTYRGSTVITVLAGRSTGLSRRRHRLGRLRGVCHR